MNPDELIEWVEQDSENRAITLDVSERKFGEYLKNHGIPQDQSSGIRPASRIAVPELFRRRLRVGGRCPSRYQQIHQLHNE